MRDALKQKHLEMMGYYRSTHDEEKALQKRAAKRKLKTEDRKELTNYDPNWDRAWE